MKPPKIKFKHFKQWLDNQPNDRKFEYTDCRKCMIVSFFREFHGIEVSACANHYRLINNYDYELIPSFLNPYVKLINWNEDIAKAKVELKDYE